MFVAGYYEAGDSGMIDEDGYISVMARTDEVINVAGGLAARAHCLMSVVAGHRLSTGALEEVVLREASKLHLPWSTLALQHTCPAAQMPLLYPLCAVVIPATSLLY